MACGPCAVVLDTRHINAANRPHANCLALVDVLSKEPSSSALILFPVPAGKASPKFSASVEAVDNQ